jgi:uncharacterized membrane protein
MSPFDPKAALLAKHAQHVVFIHFPIALFVTGVAFDLAARWTKANTRAAARLNIFAAAVLVLPTIATGLVAWQWQLEGQKLKGILLLHLVLGSISAILIWLVAAIHFQLRRSDRSCPYCVGLEIITVLVVGAAAHLGGFLSGVNVG